jgi:hypothetical protein
MYAGNVLIYGVLALEILYKYVRRGNTNQPIPSLRRERIVWYNLVRKMYYFTQQSVVAGLK